MSAMADVGGKITGVVKHQTGATIEGVTVEVVCNATGAKQATKTDVEFRKFTAEQAGLGFHMPTVVPKLPVAPCCTKKSSAKFAIIA